MTTSRPLPLRHALALGLLHGPTELLPVSSSGHTTLVPWLAGWPYAGLDGDLRKSFEVALHVGTAAALAIRPPHGLAGASPVQASRAKASSPWVSPTGASPAMLAAAIVPAAAAGYALHDQIERRLGTPGTIAAGLLAGSAAMALAELRARRVGDGRGAQDARVGDGLALGLAQAAALVPGVSRSGAAWAAMRARGFDRISSDRLSWQAGLPVIFGAALLQGSILARRGAPRGAAPVLAIGAAGAFASTLAATRALGPGRRGRAALPAAAYRTALACAVIARAAAGRPGALGAKPRRRLRRPSPHPSPT